MRNVYLDPYIFACPAVADGLDSFNDFVEVVVRLKNIKDYGYLNAFINANTFDILSQSGKYPLWSDISVTLNYYNINYIQPQDIIGIVHACLEKTLSVQDHLKIVDYLSDCTIIVEMPKQRENIFNDAFEELLIYMGLNDFLNQEGQENHILLTRNYQNKNVTISTNVLLAEFENNKNRNDIVLSYNFKAYADFGNLLSELSATDCWAASKTKKHYEISLDLHLRAFCSLNGICYSEDFISNLDFHKDFFEDIAEHHFNNDLSKIEILLRAISYTLSDTSLTETHALRESIGANSDQITNEGYKAWRRDIDYEYHLHYWKKGATIIIANVVHHNNFKISSI